MEEKEEDDDVEKGSDKEAEEADAPSAFAPSSTAPDQALAPSTGNEEREEEEANDGDKVCVRAN